MVTCISSPVRWLLAGKFHRPEGPTQSRLAFQGKHSVRETELWKGTNRECVYTFEPLSGLLFLRKFETAERLVS